MSSSLSDPKKMSASLLAQPRNQGAEGLALCPSTGESVQLDRGGDPPNFSHPNISKDSPCTLSLAFRTLKAHRRTCSATGCKNGVVQGGLCVKHGAKRRPCRFPGCTKNSKNAGLCSKHGPARKKCEYPNCANVAVRGGKCKSHGAWSKMCSVEGCPKVAAISGKCKRHYFMEKNELANSQDIATVDVARSNIIGDAANKKIISAAAAAIKKNNETTSVAASKNEVKHYALAPYAGQHSPPPSMYASSLPSTSTANFPSSYYSALNSLNASQQFSTSQQQLNTSPQAQAPQYFTSQIQSQMQMPSYYNTSNYGASSAYPYMSNIAIMDDKQPSAAVMRGMGQFKPSLSGPPNSNHSHFYN